MIPLVLVTGPIGSGKSTVCTILERRGIPVYDCDERAKELYARYPAILEGLEQDFSRLAALIFSDKKARRTLEDRLYPVMLEDIRAWQRSFDKAPEGETKPPFLVVESAIMLQKPIFDGLPDAVVVVEASPATRLSRVQQRDNATPEQVTRRMKAQQEPAANSFYIITNNGSLQDLNDSVEIFYENIHELLQPSLRDPVRANGCKSS